MLLVILTMPLLLSAQQVQEFHPLEPTVGFAYNVNDIGAFFNSVFRVGIGVAAVLAVIMIMIGGFEYLTSDIPGRKSDGKDKMTGAVSGLLLILLSVVLLNVINPDIVGLRLFTSQITPPASNSYRITDIPFGQTCRDIRGDGWVTVDSKFCGATLVGQQSCCGFFSDGIVGSPSPTNFEFQDTEAFTPDDPAIERFIRECTDQKGGGVNSRCDSESYDADTDTTACEEIIYECLR